MLATTSEARIRANQQNSLRSTGPRTSLGREKARRNAITHGMTSKILIPDGDVPEVERRTAALMAELDPKSTVGKVLVGQLATLSVRMERGASHELATSASRVRHAVETFDHDREDRAEDLFDAIADDPRKHVRLLKRMPEGVDRLIEGWEDLRDNLTRPDGPAWDDSHETIAAQMLGYRPGHAGAARLGQLSKAARGARLQVDIALEGLDREAGKAWGRDRLVELIEEQIAKLEVHRETLNLEAIEQDRVEAPNRVLFDFSRDGYRAMRYQSEARRMFFKALKDFRIAEAEAAASPAVAQAAPTPQSAPEPVEPLASFREKPAPAAREPEPAPLEGSLPPIGRPDGLPRGLDGRVLAVGRAVVVPG